jgi:hypothetical protein
MSSEKYIGLDVHQATISVAVMDSQGKLIMESVPATLRFLFAKIAVDECYRDLSIVICSAVVCQ